VKKPSWRTVLKGLVSYGVLTFLAYLVIATVTLVYGISMVSPEIVDHSYPLYVVIPWIVTIATISGTALLAYYYLIVAAILASVALFLLSSHTTYISELKMKAKSREHSAIFDVAGLLFAILFFNTAVVLLVQLMGGEVEGVGEELDVWEMLFVLANASVWEELVTRVLLVGIPLILVHRLKGGLHPGRHRYILGGGFRMGRPEVILILASSLMFGFAHLAGGWGAWKILPTAVAGMAFGYLFLRYGLASAIVLHFGIDYMQMPMSVFDSFAVEVLTILAVLLWLCLGLITFIYYVTRVVEFVTDTRLLEPKPRAVPMTWTYPGGQPVPQSDPRYPPAPQPAWTYPPPVQTPPPPGATWGFVCPNCGHLEARWIDGRFQCLRCGHLS